MSFRWTNAIRIYFWAWSYWFNYFFTYFFKPFNIHCLSHIFNIMLHRSYPLLNWMNSLFLWLIWQFDILSYFYAIFEKLFGQFIRATFSNKYINLIIFMKVMLHQLYCPKVVSLILFNSDHLAFVHSLLDYIDHIIPKSRTSTVIVKDQNQSTTISNDHVHRTFVSVWILMIIKWKPIQQTLRMNSDNRDFSRLWTISIF